MEDEFINKKIDAVLQSADKIERAEPRPFLFTRIEARMQNEKNVWSKISSFVARPVVAFACICFVLIINAMVILLANTSGSNALTQNGSELAAADEYSQVGATSLYEFENVKP
jgi:hypothetical protein